MLICDFETRSAVDLLTAGAYRYAADASTEAICCCFLLPETGDWWAWKNFHLFEGKNVWPKWLNEYLAGDGLLAAHNANFDRLIWQYAMPTGPEIPLERWYCTSAMCRVNGLPAKLDDAARAIDPKHRKDHRGAALIRKHSIPQDDGTFNEDKESLLAMVEYCQQDVRLTAYLIAHCRSLTQAEHQDWLVNERINNRGVRIDAKLASLAQHHAKQEQDEIAIQLAEITLDAITKHTQTKRICDWVRERVDDETPMVRYKKGVKKYSVDKSVRAELMDDAELDADVREVLQLTDDGNRSSVAKFKRMLDRQDDDGRARGSFIYAGAGTTLRYSSRGLQLHNMRRDCLTEQETLDLLYDMEHHPDDMLLDGERIMDVLSKALRPTLIPDEGKKFVIGDWSAVEAMGLPWLSNSRGGERVLDLFKRGEDIYMHTAKALHSNDRQLGKVAILSLGFGGALGALGSMARAYGISLSLPRMQQVVTDWRTVNAWAPVFWYSLLEAAKHAISYPGEIFTAGRVKYVFARDLLGGTLLCLLPGDIVLQYPQARLEMVETKFGNKLCITALKASWTAAQDAKHWPRNILWHGLLAENVTQAFCAGLLRHTLKALDDVVKAYASSVVMHVHDEIVLEVGERDAYAAQFRLHEVMNAVPEWAKGLPLSANPTIQNRYGGK